MREANKDASKTIVTTYDRLCPSHVSWRKTSTFTRPRTVPLMMSLRRWEGQLEPVSVSAAMLLPLSLLLIGAWTGLISTAHRYTRPVFEVLLELESAEWLAPATPQKHVSHRCSATTRHLCRTLGLAELRKSLVC